MRLTSNLLAESLQLMNPSEDRMLVLRANKISVIENLELTKDQYACIDLSSNDIARLDGVPRLPHLRTLLLSDNKVVRISASSIDNVPNLISLILTRNHLGSLHAIQPLFRLQKLERLSLLDNPVTELADYRKIILKMIPSLKFLDFEKVTKKEREEAASMEEIHSEGMEVDEFARPEKLVLTPAMSLKLRRLIEEARTLEEISRLENALKTGEVDSQLAELLNK